MINVVTPITKYLFEHILKLIAEAISVTSWFLTLQWGEKYSWKNPEILEKSHIWHWMFTFAVLFTTIKVFIVSKVENSTYKIILRAIVYLASFLTAAWGCFEIWESDLSTTTDQKWLYENHAIMIYFSYAMVITLICGLVASTIWFCTFIDKSTGTNRYIRKK